MTDMEVSEIFDDAFVSVTGRLASLNLDKMDDGIKDGDKIIGSIFAKGKFNAHIVCEISPAVYEYIIYKMTRGAAISAMEKVLYINEYLNIVCGYALSKINNELGGASRLTVTVFCYDMRSFKKEEDGEQRVALNYETEKGKICVSVYY